MAKRSEDIWVRGTRCQLEMDGIVDDDCDSAERHAELAFARSKIQSVLCAIPPKYSEIIKMRYFTKYAPMALTDIARLKGVASSLITCRHCIGLTRYLYGLHGDQLRPLVVALGLASNDWLNETRVEGEQLMD